MSTNHCLDSFHLPHVSSSFSKDVLKCCLIALTVSVEFYLVSGHLSNLAEEKLSYGPLARRGHHRGGLWGTVDTLDRLYRGLIVVTVKYVQEGSQTIARFACPDCAPQCELTWFFSCRTIRSSTNWNLSTGRPTSTKCSTPVLTLELSTPSLR